MPSKAGDGNSLIPRRNTKAHGSVGFCGSFRNHENYVSKREKSVTGKPLEGIKNKVMKRMAYGYRDSDYFCLKIKAAFPGNP